MRNWNWGTIDEIVASFARPWQQYTCGGAVAFAAAYSVYMGADAVVIGITVPSAAAVATGTAYMRTMDKKTAATTEISKNKPSPDTTVTAEIK